MRHLVLAICLIVGAAAPLAADESSHSATPPSQPSFHEWQVWDVKADQPVSTEPWLTDLASANIIYLGEEHRNRWHIEAALKILRSLAEKNLRPALAMEMFGWDGQSAIHRYLSSSPPSRDQFLQDSRWEE